MKAVPPVPDEDAAPDLAELATDVRRARQLVLARRVAPVARDDLVLAQQVLLQAMEAYVAGLVLRRLPIPPRLHADLRLQRDIYGGPRSRAQRLRG